MRKPTFQELHGHLDEDELKFKRYKKNRDDKKRTLLFKATTLIKENENKIKSVEEVDDDEKMALLSKLQRTVKAKKNNEKSKATPKNNILNKND